MYIQNVYLRWHPSYAFLRMHGLSYLQWDCEDCGQRGLLILIFNPWGSENTIRPMNICVNKTDFLPDVKDFYYCNGGEFWNFGISPKNNPL